MFSGKLILFVRGLRGLCGVKDLVNTDLVVFGGLLCNNVGKR